MFLKDRDPDWANVFQDTNWVAKSAYLSDIFLLLNQLNLSL